MKFIFLVGYTVIVCGITIYSYFKKYNPIYCALWTAYAVSAIFCILCKVYQGTLVGSDIFHDRWYDLSDTTWWGYLVLILCTIIAFKPLKIFDNNKALLGFGKTKSQRNFFIIYSCIYIFGALIFILPSLSNIVSILSTNDLGSVRLDLYSNGENEASNVVIATNFISSISLKLCLQLKYLSIFIGFGMIKERTKPILSGLTLLLTFLIYFINCNANAARGGLLIFAFNSGLIGICFYKYLSRDNKRKVIVIASIAIVVVFSFFITVTISRFANDGGGGNPILRNVCFYLGHAPLEFSKITGSLKEFAYGKTILGRLANHYLGTPYNWTTVAHQIGYPDIDALFVTYLGFLYTDFGSIGCIIFTSIWSLCTYNLLKKRPNNISTIYFFLYYLHFYTTGIFVVGRLEYASLITTILGYFMIRLIEKSELKKYFSANIILKKKKNRRNNICLEYHQK